MPRSAPPPWRVCNSETDHRGALTPLFCVYTEGTEANPMTFPELIDSITNPENGTIYWIEAAHAAKQHGLWDDFRTDYGTTASFGGVDAGEFLVWLGY